jgi:hypothetical protein
MVKGVCSMDWKINNMIKIVQRTRTYKNVHVCDDLYCKSCKDKLELSAQEFKEKIVKKLWEFADKNK